MRPPETFDSAQEVDAILRQLAGFDATTLEKTLVDKTGGLVQAARGRIDEVLNTTSEPRRRMQIMYQDFRAACDARNYHAALPFLEERLKIARELKLSEEPELVIEHGKLCLTLGDFEKAYGIFRVICRKYKEWKLSANQTHEAFWLLLKAWHLNPVSEVNEHMLQKKHVPLLQEAERHHHRIFLDILRTVEMVIAFRRGPQVTTTGYGKETGYDETIRRGQDFPDTDNPRTSVESQRLMGAAYLKKADNAISLLKGAGGKTVKPQLLDWANTARDHNQRAIDAARKLPAIECEGELGRIMYNQAKTLVLRCQIDLGNGDFIGEAVEALKALRQFGKRIGNADFINRAWLVQSDLLRLGISEVAGPSELQAALRANHHALEGSERKTDVIVSALINSAQILLALDEKIAAKRCVLRLMQIYTTCTDRRIINALEEPVRELCKAMEIRFQKPNMPA